MADETQIIPSEDATPVPDKPIDAETLMAAGDALSKSMLFTLRRDYLDESVLEDEFVQLIPDTSPQQQDIAFFL